MLPPRGVLDDPVQRRADHASRRGSAAERRLGDAMGRILGASGYALVVAVVVMVMPLEAGRSERDGGERWMKWEGRNGFVGVEWKRRQE
jgi:hypothetical protein